MGKTGFSHTAIVVGLLKLKLSINKTGVKKRTKKRTKKKLKARESLQK